MSNSIGDLKNSGLKGNNWPWQYKMLKGLQGIINAINNQADGTEYEAKIVSITCVGPDPFAGTELYLEVRVWDTENGGWTGPPTYYLPGSNTGVPLVDFTSEGCTITYLEGGDATEATLAAILAMNTQIELDTTQIATNTTPITGVVADLRRETTPGAVGILVKSVSIANVGSENGTVLGTVLAAGETITFDAGSLNNTLAGIAYDPTDDGSGGVSATTFLIATLT
jgi:hypothetical protein